MFKNILSLKEKNQKIRNASIRGSSKSILLFFIFLQMELIASNLRKVGGKNSLKLLIRDYEGKSVAQLVDERLCTADRERDKPHTYDQHSDPLIHEECTYK